MSRLRSAVLIQSCVAMLLIPAGSLADELAELKTTCIEIGFKPKTEAFGQCVLELRNRQRSKVKESAEKHEVESTPRSAPLFVQETRGDGSPDDKLCTGYGFKPGTTSYAQCRQQVEVARRDAQQRQAQYALELQRFEEEKRQYEEQVEEYEREKERQRNLRLLQFGAALAGGNSPYFLENLANASRQMLGMPPEPPRSPPPQTFFIQGPSGNRTCTVNGNLVSCF